MTAEQSQNSFLLLHEQHYNSAAMEGTYRITPEMMGQSWRRSLLLAAAGAAVGVVLWAAASYIFHWRHSGVFLSAAMTYVVCALLTWPLSTVKLRVTEESIEDLDGPVIRSNEVARVNEYANAKIPGIEILAKSKLRWIRDYRIFVPAALPQYEEIKSLVRAWTGAQDWRIV